MPHVHKCQSIQIYISSHDTTAASNIYIYIVCFSVSGHPPLLGPSSGPFRRSSSVPTNLCKCQFKNLFLDAAVVSFIYVLYYFITEMNLKIFEYFDIYAHVA